VGMTRAGRHPAVCPRRVQSGSTATEVAPVRRRVEISARFGSPRDVTGAFECDLWRRLHQTRAVVSHYQRRGDPLPAHLRDWARPRTTHLNISD
jgi:hypothetical protein